MLDILIASVDDRKQECLEVENEFKRQGVEPIILRDNRVMPIGEKRQRLLEMATQPWIVFFDDDDWPHEHYVKEILAAIDRNPQADCLGIHGVMTTDGKNHKTWCHRLGYPIAGDGTRKTKYGYDYVRHIIHFNPVKREKALQAGFDKTMRWGEDMDYANRLNPLLTCEEFVPINLFHYRYSTKIPHNEKYGIK